MVASLLHRELKPGSTGWCARDLDDSEIASQWEATRVEMVEGVIASMPSGPRVLVPGAVGFTATDLRDDNYRAIWDTNRYEMVRGVIAQMPPPFFEHGACVHELLFLVRAHLKERGQRAWSSSEVDLVLHDDLIFRADGVLLLEENAVRERRSLFSEAGRLTRLTLPPLLVIESVSLGHERHDREVKRRHYAQFGVPNYWIVDVGLRSLDCLRLRDGVYVEDATAHDVGELSPTAFPGLTISLKDVFL